MPETKAATTAVAKKKSVKEKPTVKTNVSAPTHDEIALRAYAKWENMAAIMDLMKDIGSMPRAKSATRLGK